MKKIYLLDYDCQTDLSLSDIIDDYFDGFNVEPYQVLERDSEWCVFTRSLQEALDIANESEAGFATIIEYSLSEDDLCDLFFGKDILSEPTNSWYFWREPSQQKLVPVSKFLKVFV